MSNELSVTNNYIAFQQLLAKVDVAVEAKDWEQAIQFATNAANWAWLHSCGIFASPELEALLARIGEALPDRSVANRGVGKRHVVTVISSAFETGGHTRLATRWMAVDKNSRHTLVLTRQERTPLPSLITDLVADGTLELVVLDDASCVDRVQRLRDVLATGDRAVLHIHPDDAMAVVAIAGLADPPPVLFEDHANHVFWIGASIANVLISLHEAGIRVATDRRGIDRAHMSWVPAPMNYAKLDHEDSQDIRARYGIPEDAVLLMSSGAGYKFIPIEGVSLAALLEPVLEARPDTHVLLVGLSADPVGTSLAARYPQRVHLAGYLKEADLIDCYRACDIYLESVPFPSGTALAEAAAAGCPILKFAPSAWRQCSFTVDIDAVPSPAYIWSDEAGYRSDLLHIIDHPELRRQRGRFARDAVRLCHSDETFLSTLETAYAVAPQLPRIALDADTCAHRIELLDDLLLKLARNLESASQSTSPIAVARALTPHEAHAVWLAPQRLSASQIDALQPVLHEHGRIQVVVLALREDPAAVETTLLSLCAQSFTAYDIRVLSAADFPRGSAPHESQDDPDWVTPYNALAANGGVELMLALHAGDTLSADALMLLAARFAEQPALTCCYMDEDAHEEAGLAQPILKPDLNLDLLRSYPYIGRTLAIRRSALLAVDGLRTSYAALAHYDFVFRAIERFGLHTIGHLAEVQYHAGLSYVQWLSSPAVAALAPSIVSEHLQRLGVAHEMLPGSLPGFNRVRYLHDRQPPVSIIVPTRDQLPLLNGLIDSLLSRTSYTNYELLIVDNDSQEPAACAYLDGIERLSSPQLRVLRYPHPFNYSAINNFAAAQARGEYLILLNNDTAVLQDDWIEALLNHAQRPEVGIVGAKLHYPDGRIQHGGVVLGLRGPADHPFIGLPMDATGYMHRLQVDQNYTAVTAACLMIRKSVYDSVGGLDEEDFKVSYNDVDLCLKVHQAGYLTVWTPYARLMHVGSVSQTNVDKTAQEAKHKRFQGEQHAMYRKWLPLLARDPAYNRNLNLDGPGFELDPRRSFAWQPFARSTMPRMYCVAADATGCGNYRVMQPFISMQREGIAEGMIADSHLTPINMERFGPDTIVLQRQLSDHQLNIMRNYKDFSRAFKVYELDDYLPQVPIKSAFHKTMPKDVLKVLRKAVALTDRFIVSTAPLAEQFAGLHADIRVVPNRLPVHWWSDLDSQRRTSRKPRVGWGGGASHRGDLELIADVVRDLADEVEWVFFGMCPDKLRPYVHEFHEGVSIKDYPRKLASLNLDLALAPLEENLFNECKSNLRLLEYGVCGFPVICTDIVCYQGELPVTRVKNRYKDWMSAIRMHLDDLDAAAKAGDALRDAVRRDWMLEGDKLVAWRNAWLPN
jgi:O-antigen biosynthesis protein